MAKFQISDGSDTSVLAKVNTSGNVQVDLEEASSIIPIDIQSRYAQTIQTHNAVSVGIGAWSTGSWIDCDGFDKIAITVKNDAATSNFIGVHWSYDGVSQCGDESLGNASTQFNQAITDIKTRYVRVNVKNGAADISHTMSAWAYLKA